MWSLDVTGTFKTAILASFTFGELIQSVENSVGPGIHRERRTVAPKNLPIFIEYEKSAFCHSVFIAIRAVLLSDTSLRFKISQQRKVQVPVLGKSGVAPCAVDRNAQQFSPMFLKFGQHLVVQRHLISADRAPIRGIECENHRPSFQFAERQLLIRSDVKRKLRRLGSWT